MKIRSILKKKLIKYIRPKKTKSVEMRVLSFLLLLYVASALTVAGSFNKNK